MKEFLSLLTLVFSLSVTLLPSAASASASDYDLLGFSQVEYELAINPCIDETVLLKRFGADALRVKERELREWPHELCQHMDVSSKLLTWNYYYTNLLANTERPGVFAAEINKHLSTLKNCTDVACLNRQLPRMTEWVYFNIDRLPVYTDSESARRSKATVAGEPVLHPGLALRNLPLTLSGQSEVCRGGTTNDLDFFTVNFAIEGRPLVLAVCKELTDASSNEQGVWLLERLESSGEGLGLSGWREILVEREDSRLYVLTNSRTSYPTLYSRRLTGSGEEVVIYEFREAKQHYERSVALDIEYDALGRAHAFMQ